GWTPVGQPDPKLGNGARVRDGSLELMGSIQLVHPFAAADVELRARVRKTPGQNVGFWLRRSKAGQYAVWFDGAKFSIGKSVPDVGYTSLAVADAPKGPATAHSITAIASGSVVTVAVDGQELLRVNDPAPLGPGCVGVTTYNSGKTQVRDIDARALPTADLIEPETPEVPAEAEPEAAPKPEPEPGKWVTLFDGKSLDGWEAEGDAAFAIEEGVLVARYGRGGGRLRTARPWSNFELRFVYRRLQPGNAGLWFRDGYKYDIAARPGHRSGSLYCKDKGFLASNPDGALEKRDDWNEAQVYAKGDHLMLWLNDRQVADVHDATFAEGPICIEVSALGARSLELAILRIDIRPLRPDDPPDLLKPGGADKPEAPEAGKGK
ncbi:DUF1080 domain-containing protein, partial [bacterium]|nr:DUF1080 domain-containing protein [bacterium]